MGRLHPEKMNMFKCHICGSTESHDKLVTDVFMIDGKPVLVENIPVQVCAHCGEEVYSRETTEKIRVLVRGSTKPAKSIKMDVFDYV